VDCSLQCFGSGFTVIDSVVPDPDVIRPRLNPPHKQKRKKYPLEPPPPKKKRKQKEISFYLELENCS
jgi:hypothetical protein